MPVSESALGVRIVDEVLARIQQLDDDPTEDFFGTGRERLIESLPFDAAQRWLSADFTSKPDAAETWEQQRELPEAALSDYLRFAVSKAYGHRGLSAGRSINHVDNLAWLLGDEAFAKVTNAAYPQYGMPKLKAAAELVGASWPPVQYDNGEPYPDGEAAEIERMAAGDPCEPGCDMGCGE